LSSLKKEDVTIHAETPNNVQGYNLDGKSKIMYYNKKVQVDFKNNMQAI
jgi:hypothetical protein